MNIKYAYSLGVDSGIETARYGEFSRDALLDYDTFLQEASDVLENKRQFADSPIYEFAREPNSDALFDAFDNGETVGLAKGWRAMRQDRANAQAEQELEDALGERERGEFEGLIVSDISEITKGFRGLVLHVNDHGNVTLYLKTARKLREIASRV